MNNRRSRKKELARRIFVYSIMTVSMLGLLVLFTYKILGYQFNFTTRTLEQTGLVQFDSFPRSATVQIDGKKLESSTRTKNSVLPGMRQFSMSLAGYSDWQKAIDIKAGTVTWLDYIRLVPLDKTIEDVQSVGNLLTVRKSPDDRFMAGVSKGPLGVYQLVLIDFRGTRLPKLAEYVLPVGTMTGFMPDQSVEHSFSVESWDNTGRRVLVKHSFSGDVSGSEWLWIDRERPLDLVNINTLTNLSIVDVRHGKDGEVYTQQSNGDVRKLEVNTGNVSRPLLSNVVNFGVYDDTTVYYIGTQGESIVAGIRKDSWNEPIILDNVNRSQEQNLKISVSRYFNQDTVVLSKGTSVLVFRGDLPVNPQQKDVFMEKFYGHLTLSRPLESLSVSKNGRFVIAEDDKGFVSYDLELKSVSQQIKKYHISAIRWLDDYHVWQIGDNNVMIMQEFDGVNSHQLIDHVTLGFDTILTSDERFVYAFVSRADETGQEAVWLKRLYMTID